MEEIGYLPVFHLLRIDQFLVKVEVLEDEIHQVAEVLWLFRQ